MIFLWFFVMFSLYFVTVLSILTGSYAVAKFQWLIFSKLAINVFAKEVDNKYFCFFIKEKMQKYLFLFYLFAFLNIIPFAFFTWIWIMVWEDYWYLIGFTSLFIMSYLSFFVSIKRFVKYLKNIGVFEQEIAIKNFNDFLKIKNFNKNKEFISFTLYKNDEVIAFNKIINFHQERFKNKIIKIYKKENIDNQKTLDLIKVFNLYLKRWAYFVTKINNEANNYYLKIDDKRYEIENLPKILIHNFLNNF